MRTPVARPPLVATEGPEPEPGPAPRRTPSWSWSVAGGTAASSDSCSAPWHVTTRAACPVPVVHGAPEGPARRGLSAPRARGWVPQRPTGGVG